MEDVLARTSNWEGYRLVEAALLALLAALREPRIGEGLVHLDLRSSSWIAVSLLPVLLLLLSWMPAVHLSFPAVPAEPVPCYI